MSVGILANISVKMAISKISKTIVLPNLLVGQVDFYDSLGYTWIGQNSISQDVY